MLRTIAIAIACFSSFGCFVYVACFGVVFEPLAKRSVRLVFEEFATAVKVAEQIIKAGNDQDSDDRADKHAAGSRGADGSVPDRPGASGHDQRKHGDINGFNGLRH